MFQLLELVDIRERPEIRIECPQLIHRDVAGVEGLDHGTQREGCVTFEIREEGSPPVHRMQRFEHLLVPPWYNSNVLTDCSEEIRNHAGIDAGHIAGRNENKIPSCHKGTGMKPANWAEALPDIADTCNLPQLTETGALPRIAGDDHDLICDTG